MSHAQQHLLAQLVSSPNELAAGLGQCLEALRLISTLPRSSPVFVRYASAPSPTLKAFGRDHLSRVPLRTAIALIRSSLALADGPPLRVAAALFYREDGTVDPTPVLVDEDSWKELAPHVHTLHVEDDRAASLSPLSTPTMLAGNAITANGTGSPPPSAAGVCAGSKGAYVPSSSPTLTVKSSGTGLLGLRKASFSRITSSPPQPTSPFAILDNTGTCV